MPRLIATAGLLVCVIFSTPVRLRAGETPPPEPLVTANTGFALRLYQQVIADQPGDVVLGPHSISQALALAQAGAADETRREMDATLGWTGLGDGLHPAWQTLRTGLAQASGIELAMANRLFLQRGAPFLDSYLALCRDQHDAEPETCDFKADPEVERQKINAWVGKETRDRIPELIKREPPVIDRDTQGVLVNACYFKGGFTTPFTIHATETPADFHSPGSKTTCALMHRLGTMAHGGDDQVDVIRLDYGKAGSPAAHLTLMVPKAVDGLAAWEKGLTADRLTALMAGLKPRTVDLALPRFTSRTPVQLGDPLQKMGMKLAFDSKKADFSAMSGEPLYISAVVHEAWVATDEAGSEAAAATAVIMKPRGMASPPPSTSPCASTGPSCG
jgi:serpin B